MLGAIPVLHEAKGLIKGASLIAKGVHTGAEIVDVAHMGREVKRVVEVAGDSIKSYMKRGQSCGHMGLIMRRLQGGFLN